MSTPRRVDLTIAGRKGGGSAEALAGGMERAETGGGGTIWMDKFITFANI